VQRIQLRHRGYRLLLTTISTVLLLQPLARRWPWLTPLMSIGVALVMMLFLTRYSPLVAHKRVFYGVGIATILSEMAWLAILLTDTSLASIWRSCIS